jgi:hypothetical protein
MATVDAAGLAATRAVEAATRRATGWAITRRIIFSLNYLGLSFSHTQKKAEKGEQKKK